MRRASLLILCLALCACAPPRVDDPINLISNHMVDSPRREAADQQALRESPNDPRFAAALREVLWGPPSVFTTEERLFAVDQLVRIDEAAFRRDVAKHLLENGNFEVLERILKYAVDRNWTDFTPVAVRHYARTIHGLTDDKRPERAVIEKLNPGKTVEEVIFATFADMDGKSEAAEQSAAWELLNRLTPRERVLTLMASAPATTPVVADLKACAADLHTVPVNREGVLWLAYLRDPARKAWWDRAKALVATLNQEQRTGLELRHLTILLQADAQTMKMTRAELVRDVGATLAGAEHHLTSAPLEGQAQDYPQEFRYWVDKLVWADLVSIRVLDTATQDRGVVASLFAQADADHEDTSTEYGGVLLMQGEGAQARPVAKLYKPTLRLNDMKFVPPQRMIEECYTGLAHYHFHAQRIKNSDFAGPGRGDLGTAERLNFNMLVFTFIDRNRLNVDFYCRGGIVVDLGTVRR